jgi:hypothetical protein
VSMLGEMQRTLPGAEKMHSPNNIHQHRKYALQPSVL